MSSRRFLLRRVWHLAIPTPPSMGYSPTEYAELTEPPAEMSSHGFHRFTQILRVRCSPTESTEFGSVGMAGMPYPPTSVPSVGGSSLPEVSVRSVRSVGISFLPRISQIYTDVRVRCSPTEFTEYTEFGSVGMAGMPYPPTSVNIRVICGRLFSARSFCEFRAFCGNIFSPTDFTDLHRYLGCAVLPQNSQNTQNLAAWVWQGCHTLLHLCASVSSVGVLSLQEVLCIRCIPWELLHRLSVGAAETAAPPGLSAWVWQGCHTLLHL